MRVPIIASTEFYALIELPYEIRHTVVDTGGMSLKY